MSIKEKKKKTIIHNSDPRNKSINCQHFPKYFISNEKEKQKIFFK